MRTRVAVALMISFLTVASAVGQNLRREQAVKGTLVVAVPVPEGLVVCSDKRLFNDQAHTYTDTFVKIHKVSRNALFVATNTVGFLDTKTGRLGFDAFAVTANYVSRRSFSPDRTFWDGLKSEIKKELLAYLADQKYEDLPETDRENNKLLFNLVFYLTDRGSARSYTIRVFYEKARSPIVDVSGPIGERVQTPKLTGKGRDVMNYVANDPNLRQDQFILRFDQGSFDIQKTTVTDAVAFSRRLFEITNRGVPAARVSATFDCALLDHKSGFRWINN